MMPVYIGSLGRMVKLPYVGSQQLQTEGRYSFETTLEGKRKAQVKPRGPRTWELSSDHFRPNEHAQLSQFADGAWGPGPFVFVPADAAHTNLLTPAMASCDPAEQFRTDVWSSGAMVTPEGVAARSYSSADGVPPIIFGRDALPVIPGSKIVVSAYVLGAGAAVRAQWYDADGAPMTVTTGMPQGGATVVRATLGVTVPAGSHGVKVSVINALQASMPAMTWGETLQPWGDGQGCLRAVVHGVTRDQVLAVPGHTYSNVGFTVTEVG